ncbi:retrovirus-related Pol polyprotein from transposon 412 [Trichonephila clavipes]|nr:retrovirus-related Pol polyprotein from transposon 412 [Trichonephila clavipes]
MQEFHDLRLAGHLGKRKTYLKLRDTCYFPYMRKYIFEYVSTCDRCQKFNYKNALPAGRLIPIVSNYPDKIVTLDLLGPHPASRPERYRFLLVITDHFTKWSELIPLRKASAQAIANALFENYISRYGAPISLISDNGPEFISEVFEHLSHRLDIKHIKTVTYRPQSNLTETVNRTLVQMITCFVEENHHNWDRLLHEFAFVLRTSVNEMIGKTPAELLGRKIITPFSKLINVTEDVEYVGGNIEKLFDEARQNMRKQHKTWEKYYNRKRREVNIKVNDLVLVQTHFISTAGRKVVGKFMPKFDLPYRVLEVRNNNLIIWKKGKRVTVNIDQVRVYHPRQSDTICFDSHVETLYEGQRFSNGSSRSHPGKSKKSRKTLSEESKGCKSNKGNAGLEDPGLKRKVRSNGSVERFDKKKVQNMQEKISAGVRTWGPEKTNPFTTTGPSHQLHTSQCKPLTEESRQGARVQYDRARETRTTPSKGNSAADRRPVRSRQATAVRPCPYYLRSRLKNPEGIPEEQRSTGIDSLPQNNLRRRSFSMEALDRDPMDRSE